MREIDISTERKTQLVEITRDVEAALNGVEGATAALVFVPHTTAGVTINEHADPAVARDLEAAMERMVREDWGWQHIEDGEENAPSHVRAALAGPQVLIPIDGRAARARHLAGDLLLRVRRSAEAQGLRHASDLIEVENLTKRFRKTVAVDDLSFKIREGAITGFLGPNGAGKTTTLRVILGLVHPTAGRATVMGRLYRQLESPTQQVGAVLEASDFHPGRSGRNHLRVLAAATGIPRSRVEEVLEVVDLQDAAGRRAGGYSLGMRQRLSLAGALLGDPRILVLDEPANGLDPQGIRWLREFLRSLAAEGRTIFISSHVLAEVEQIVDEVVIIHRGKFVVQATTAELVARAAGGIRARSPQADQLRAALEQAGVKVASSEGDLLTLADATTAQVGEIAAAKGIVLHELVAESSSLEEAFLDLTSQEEAP